jgi:Protein kinase domain
LLRDGPLPLEQALDIARQVCGGLAALHARGIVHRDLKPENIHLTASGQVKILLRRLLAECTDSLTYVQRNASSVRAIADYAPQSFQQRRAVAAAAARGMHSARRSRLPDGNGATPPDDDRRPAQGSLR